MKFSIALYSALLVTFACFSHVESSAQSIYRSDLGGFVSIDFAESVVRGHERLEGPGLGGRIGFRSKYLELGLFMRRASDQEYGSDRWSAGSITFGPLLGVTHRRKGRDDGYRFTASAWVVRTDHTVRVNPPDGPTEYKQGPDITAHSLRASFSYFREVALSEVVSIWPMIGVYAFYREDYPEVEYYFPDGRETQIRKPSRSEHSLGMLVGLPITMEISPGHLVGLELLLEVEPYALFF